MDKIKELLPKDKFDDSTLAKLKQLSKEEIQPILPFLLNWIADMNWPIAEAMIHVLVQFQSILTPLLREKLKPKELDDILKNNIIWYLVPLLSVENQDELLDDIIRILKKPTESELSEGLPETVCTYLNRYKQTKYGF